MKTLLVLTDFSPHSKHAAAYAFDLAGKIEANIMLAKIIRKRWLFI